MNLEEAEAWMYDKRSMGNVIPSDPFETWQLRIAQADAAMMEQAYWVLKAYKDRLILPPRIPDKETP